MANSPSARRSLGTVVTAAVLFSGCASAPGHVRPASEPAGQNVGCEQAVSPLPPPAEGSARSLAQRPGGPPAGPLFAAIGSGETVPAGLEVGPAAFVAPDDQMALPTGPAAVSAEPMPLLPLGFDDPDDPFAGMLELAVDRLIFEVEERNPSLQVVSEAWRAAARRYPQVVSLDDPMFALMVGPAGIGHDGGWMVEASQRFPWACKRYLRGRVAEAEAEAARGQIGDVRLRLAEASKMAYYDYYLARRQLEVNAETTGIVEEFFKAATARYEANQATAQDVLQADVELADLAARREAFVRKERVAIARLNTLLHRPPAHAIPPPPANVGIPDTLPDAFDLLETAIRSRPDLYSIASRIQAEESSLALAHREFYPDLELVAKYDAFMPEEMRAQVGLNLNVPLQRQRRLAAVAEAQATLCQQRAEYQERVDEVRYEVQAAYELLAEAYRVARLYATRILPSAEESLKSAIANYTAGRIDLLRLIDAERTLNEQRERYYQSVAELHQRQAQLDRATGGGMPLY